MISLFAVKTLAKISLFPNSNLMIDGLERLGCHKNSPNHACINHEMTNFTVGKNSSKMLLYIFYRKDEFWQFIVSCCYYFLVFF
jgi:hypothetical protein